MHNAEQSSAKTEIECERARVKYKERERESRQSEGRSNRSVETHGIDAATRRGVYLFILFRLFFVGAAMDTL